ncbi:MAG: hypothetical protein ACOCRK_05075, partial [bacterium]
MSDNNDIIKQENISNNFIVPYSEYKEEEFSISGGGVWYYTQNTPGTKWFDIVDNNKGWTVDFELGVEGVENNDNFMVEDKNEGVGIYVNDGTYKEVINFFTQEISFYYADKSFIFDTTKKIKYRLTGQKNKLILYAKKNNQKKYRMISEIDFTTPATKQGNVIESDIFEDQDGKIYSVWMDDGNSKGQLYYSIFEEQKWSNPEIINTGDYPVESPTIIVDSNKNIYISYVVKESNYSSIGFKYKNNVGWSDAYYIGQFEGKAKTPKMIFDADENLYIVWLNKFNSDDIYLTKINTYDFNINTNKIHSDHYIIKELSVSSYLDKLYIAFINYSSIEQNYTHVNIINYNFKSKYISEIENIGNNESYINNLDIIVNVSGDVVLVWQDEITGASELYGCILNLNLDIVISNQQLTDGNGGIKNPVLSEHVSTGDVYIVWQDYITNY